jgi:paraquat-inducible protein B
MLRKSLLIWPLAPCNFTVNSGLDKIQDQIAGIATKVNKLPLESIGNNLDNTLAELGKTLRMVNGQTLPAANQLIKQTQKTTEGVQDLMAEDSPDCQYHAGTRGIPPDLQVITRSFRPARPPS